MRSAGGGALAPAASPSHSRPPHAAAPLPRRRGRATASVPRTTAAVDRFARRATMGLSFRRLLDSLGFGQREMRVSGGRWRGWEGGAGA